MRKEVKATVGAIVTRSDNGVERILLTRRTVEPFQNYFCLPGGHIDRFESAGDAVIREVGEETGLEFTPRFFGYFDEILPDLDWHAVVIVFAGPGTGTLTPEAGEVSETRWLTVAEALKLDLAFCHNEVIRAYAGR